MRNYLAFCVLGDEKLYGYMLYMEIVPCGGRDCDLERVGEEKGGLFLEGEGGLHLEGGVNRSL